MKRTFVLLGSLALLATIGVACGGGNGEDATPTATPEPTLTPVQAYEAAISKGQEEALTAVQTVSALVSQQEELGNQWRSIIESAIHEAEQSVRDFYAIEPPSAPSGSDAQSVAAFGALAEADDLIDLAASKLDRAMHFARLAADGENSWDVTAGLLDDAADIFDEAADKAETALALMP